MCVIGSSFRENSDRVLIQEGFSQRISLTLRAVIDGEAVVHVRAQTNRTTFSLGQPRVGVHTKIKIHGGLYEFHKRVLAD